VAPGAPPILEIEFDVGRGRRYLYQQIFSLGRRFTHNPLRIEKAARHAWDTHLHYRDMMASGRLSRPEAIERVLSRAPEPDSGAVRADGLTVGLAGHPYVLHDGQVSHHLIKRLRARHIAVLMPEMVPALPAGTTDGARPGAGDGYWESSEDVVGAGNYYISQRGDGLIGVMPFACGPDSLMMHLVQRRAQNADIPFMCLTVEEHTAEVGVITRLEAFLDMLERRMRRTG